MTDKDLLGQEINPNDLAFDRLWEAKPSRKGDNSKQEARRSFFRLIGAGVDPDQIIGAAIEWCEQSKNIQDRRTIPMVTTWLNQRRFEGENYSQPRRAEDRTEKDKLIAALGWHWNGERWVQTSPRLAHRIAPQPPLSLEARANLFVAADLPWYPDLVEMHRQSDGTQSYFGKSEDKQRDGIWVPKWWYDQYRYATRDKLNYSDINPVKAKPVEEAPPKKTWAEEADQEFGA